MSDLEPEDADAVRARKALEAAARVEAPPGLLPAVMQQIRSVQPSGRARVLQFNDPSRKTSIHGGSMSTKKVMAGVAAVAGGGTAPSR